MQMLFIDYKFVYFRFKIFLERLHVRLIWDIDMNYSVIESALEIFFQMQA